MGKSKAGKLLGKFKGGEGVCRSHRTDYKAIACSDRREYLWPISSVIDRVKRALWRENGGSINGCFERIFSLAPKGSKLCSFMRGTDVEDSTLFRTWTLEITSATWACDFDFFLCCVELALEGADEA
jgi:hypothetical protein